MCGKFKINFEKFSVKKPDKILPILLLIEILIISLLARIIVGTFDNYNWDDYALMQNISKNFWDYAQLTYPWSYFPTTVHYWFSNRIFGNSFMSYRLIPLIINLIIPFVVLYTSNIFRQKSYSMMVIGLLWLSFNNYTLWYSGYSLITFAVDVLLGGFFFIIFFHSFSNKEDLKSKKWQLFILISVILSFFSNIIILIPLIGGIISTSLFQYLRVKTVPFLKILFDTIRDFKVLLIIPIIHIFTQITFRNTAINVDVRPEWARMIFFKSSYSQDIFGLSNFIFQNSITFFEELLAPINYHNFDFIYRQSALLIMLLMSVSLVILILKKDISSHFAFGVVYCDLLITIMIVGSIAGIFPFGTARYGGFLLIPLIIVISYAVSVILDKLTIKIGGKLTIIILVSIIAIAVIGAYSLGGIFGNFKDRDNSYKLILDKVKNNDAEQIFFTPQVQTILAIKCPSQYYSGINIGWGTSKKGIHGFGINETMFQWIQNKKYNKILIIDNSEGWFDKEYPAWSKIIKENYYKLSDYQAPDFWIGYYIKK